MRLLRTRGTRCIVTACMMTLFAGSGMTGIAEATSLSRPAEYITCDATSTVVFTPALTSEIQQTHVVYDVIYTNCVGSNNSHITGGSRSGSYDGMRSCSPVLPAAGLEQFPVFWETGNGRGPISTVDGTAQGADLGGQTIHNLTGPVTSGPFSRDQFTETITQTHPDITACNTSGVTSQTGTGKLVIAPEVAAG